jgi:transcriptional regulator with XRE-family HTH domain
LPVSERYFSASSSLRKTIKARPFSGFSITAAACVLRTMQVGITVAALSCIERNNAEPRPSTRRKLAQALGVDPAELVEHT